MTLSDLSSYRVSNRRPISITYRNYSITSCGAPSGGSVALSILKTIEGYNMVCISFLVSLSNMAWEFRKVLGGLHIPSPPTVVSKVHTNLWPQSSRSALNTHRLDEAMRFAYAARTSLGDPDFFPYMTSLETSMLHPHTASKIRSQISSSTSHNLSHYFPSTPSVLPDSHGTSHIVATDASGLSISSTSTINLLFGSQLVVPETGVIMNNEMDDFSIPNRRNAFGLPPSPINYIRPFKRPLSSISPLIIEHENGTLYFSVGAAGGSRIPTATVQAVWHVLDHGMGVREALAERRIHDQLVPDETTFEVGFDGDVIEDLEGRGHNVTVVP